MVLRRDDIACFVANWSDKATNLRAIAEALNIGLDALVFADDNPFERELVRQALPMVAVPELGDDPALYPAILAAGGYFDLVAVTAEDRTRSELYRANAAREAWKGAAIDLDAYLRGLDMRLVWRRFDRVGLARVVQLINKSNQFNLTTSRCTEADILAVMDDPAAFGLQLRLLDRFGDNGVIAVVIGRKTASRDLVIGTWVMSCRVLGRQVEAATLSVVLAEARRLGCERVVGEYIPSARNAMVRDHYAKLGFRPLRETTAGGALFERDVTAHEMSPVFIEIVQEQEQCLVNPTSMAA
jgi:FkbH-like protein